MKYYDEDGNLVEGVLSLDEVKALQEKAARVAELEEKAKKLEEKDLNFRKLKTLTDQEKKDAQEKLRAEMESQMSERERFLLEEIESLKGTVSQRETIEKQTFAQKMEAEIAAYAGKDEDLKQKIMTQFNRLGTPATEEQLREQVEEAYTLASREIEKANPVSPLNRFSPGIQNGGWPSANEKRVNFADTPEGQALAKSLGLGDMTDPAVKKAEGNK